MEPSQQVATDTGATVSAPDEDRRAGTPDPGSRPDSPGRRLLGMLRWDGTGVLLAAVALVVVAGLVNPMFLHPASLLGVAQSAVYIGLIALGMTFLMAMRELDLSVGSTFGLSLTGAALLMQAGLDPWLAGIAGIVIGGLLGLNTALVVLIVRIPTIVATLATLLLYRGLALGLSNGQQVTGLPFDHPFFQILGGSVLGIPTSLLIVLVTIVVLVLVMHRTTFGFRVRAIGSNPEAANHAGIPISRTRTQVLILVGALAGLAGVLGLAFFSSGDPNIGAGFELQAIAAAIIGGTALRGGRACVIGAAIGAFLLATVTAAMAFLQVPANWNSFASGAVILAAVSIDGILRRRRSH